MMTDSAAPTPAERPAPSTAETADAQHLVVDDLLLVLFDPASDSIRAENILFYVLAGGVLADLTAAGAITAEDRGLRGAIVSVVDGARPTDPLLARAWDDIADKPRNVQSVLAMIGPRLRAEVIDRLVERGDLVRAQKKVLGFIPAQTLVDGDLTRRDSLIARMRAALVEGAVADDRIASLIALVSASRALPQFHTEIPWNGSVATRAAEFQRGDFEAGASAEAVTRTVNAVIINSIVGALVATTVIANR